MAQPASPGRSLVGRKLPAEVVVAEQRRRIATGLCGAIDRYGYEAATVRDVIEPVGISRRTFYELYGEKAAVFRVVHEEAIASLGTAVRRACGATPEWPAAVAAGIDAALSWAATDPLRARLALADPHSVGSHLRHCQGRLVRRFNRCLRRGRPDADAELPRRLEAMLLAGSAGAIAEALRDGRAADLPALGPALAEFVLTPYLGTAEARRVAAARLA